MIFDVFRYATGLVNDSVTTAAPHDPSRVKAALAAPNCIGVVEQIEARNRWDAMDRAKPRFAKGDCTLGKRGFELRAKKGGAS